MRLAIIAITVAAVALCAGAATADPWPNLSAASTIIDYVTVVPVFDGGTLTWTFQISVAPGATDPIWGPLDPTYGGIKAFGVYQPGSSPLQPSLIAGFGLAGPTRTGWSVPPEGGDGWSNPQSAFGWQTGPPTYYLHPGESELSDFWARWSGSAPSAEDFVYVVHVAINSDDPEGQTFWARLGEPIPEPASVVLLGLGGLGLWGLRRRRA